MKVYIAIGTVLLACGSMFAQNSVPSQPAAHSNMQMGSAQKSNSMSGMKGHMDEMQADMQAMKTQIDKMRLDAEKVQDAGTKTALLDNVDMWDKFMSRMQSHMETMMSGKDGMMHCKKPQMSPEGQTSAPDKK